MHMTAPEQNSPPSRTATHPESGSENYFDGCRELHTLHTDAPIRCIEYSANGELLALAAGDSLNILATASAALKNSIFAESHSLKFFQRNTLLLARSAEIHYLSIHDNRFLRRFPGDFGPVTALSPDPSRDIFLATSASQATLWDIRMEAPARRIPIRCSTGCLGPDGQYCLSDGNILRIFDLGSDHGPVATVAVPPDFAKKAWYTSSGHSILLAGSNGYAVLGTDGACIGRFVGLPDGDSSADSSTLLCCTRKYVLAHRLLDRRRAGTMDPRMPGAETVRASPAGSGFAVASANCFKLYAM